MGLMKRKIVFVSLAIVSTVVCLSGFLRAESYLSQLWGKFDRVILTAASLPTSLQNVLQVHGWKDETKTWEIYDDGEKNCVLKSGGEYEFIMASGLGHIYSFHPVSNVTFLNAKRTIQNGKVTAMSFTDTTVPLLVLVKDYAGPWGTRYVDNAIFTPSVNLQTGKMSGTLKFKMRLFKPIPSPKPGRPEIPVGDYNFVFNFPGTIAATQKPMPIPMPSGK